MESELWRRIDELLERALDLSVEDRRAFLDAACDNDPSLRAQVEKLLRAHGQAEGFLSASALQTVRASMSADPTVPLMGRQIAQYEVISRLGAGGMGVVYLARDTRLERTVALKFLPFHFVLDEEQKLRFLREAKASAALEHPNIGAIHEIAETSDGQMFIAMGYYEGLTLKEKIQQGPLPADEALDIAGQIAAGLSHAHGRHIVHRDIKPGNILVTREGVVKIIDFGLAKFVGRSQITRPDRILGTVAYLSPEQARGEDVDLRSDLWSLGAVLYEMLAGQVPFRAEHPQATIHRILEGVPTPLRQLRLDVPIDIERMIDRALQKDRDSRYGSAAEFLNDLGHYRSTAALPASALAPGRPVTAWLRRKRVVVPSILILVVLGALLGWFVQRQSNERWAKETLLPEISRLIDSDQYVAAFALAREAEQYIPFDPTLAKVWPVVSKTISVHTTPPGADVYMKEYSAFDAAWTYLGKSPLDKIRIPAALSRWKFEKTGYATAEDVASGWYGPVSITLDPVRDVPDGMVRVPGGRSPHKMVVSGFEHVDSIELQDFWMDRYEVSNRQFKRFLDAGGYDKREYWKQPFLKDGRIVSWDEGVAEFRDATGRRGPADWEAGDYHKGQDGHPVGGVSWYEAAAYCEFAGKSLPTVYHWNRAAIAGDAWFSSYVFPFSNFTGRGPARSGSHHGMSRRGTYDLAGNVKEWSWNEAAQRKRYILGGAWNEPAYMFHEADARSAWQREVTFGFRCIKDIDSKPRPQVLTEPVVALARNYSAERPVSEEVFRAYRDLYAYDKTPLNAVIESSDREEGWIKQRITFDAAYGKERMAAYLFLPANADPPYQTVVHFPAAESIFTRSSGALVEMPRIDFILKSGRAVLWPIYKGTYERPDDMQTYFPDTSARYRDRVIQWGKDLGRSIDYIETRTDIAANALAFYGFSWGACMGAILPAIEKRLKVSVLMGPGLYLEPSRPEVDQINFAPRVTIPTLIVDGRDDFVFPRELSQEPFYRFLGTPKEHKRLLIFDGGHSVPRHHLIRESLDWLDRYLGPVRQPTR